MKVIETYLVRYFQNRGFIKMHLAENGSYFIDYDNSLYAISDDDAKYAFEYTDECIKKENP